MTREHKISLILGFAVALIVGVMVSDHFSKARQTPLSDADSSEELTPDPRALPIVASEEPSLVLVDERGRPEPLEQIAATTLPDAETQGEAETLASADRSGFEWLRDQVSAAARDPNRGAADIEAMKTRTQFIRITAAGLRESHPHDVMITKASPNYWSS